MQTLLDRGISTRRGIMCAHREAPYVEMDHSPLPQSEAAQDRCILLPLYPQMTDAEQQRGRSRCAQGLQRMSHVDVMVVCYNYGRFLRACVESVLAQSHTNLRVVIVDDASTDDTPAICAELMSKDPRVEVVRHATNRGHIRTYNECIDLAHDDYMLLLSADDYLLPGALARAVAVLDAEPHVGLVHGAWFWCREDGTVTDPDVSGSQHRRSWTARG